jgi:hypothetical protein
MQYWIFYYGGVGGDGFRNLLEYADNITPVDGVKRWKIRRKFEITNGKVRFNNIPFTTDTNFLRNYVSDTSLNQIELLPAYRQLIESGENTVIAVHPMHYNFNHNFKYWDFIQRDQHKIILYSTDYIRVYEDFRDKVPGHDPGLSYIDYLKNMNIPINGFTNIKPHEATFIDIEQVWRDWDYLNNILISIGISLDRKYYEEYLDVSRRRPN